MDIHRCRFVPFPTSSINALAFNRPYISATTKSKSVPIRLAVGRENGSIEIWNPLDGVWHQETIIHGAAGRKVDALVWSTEPDVHLPDGKTIFGRSRLFSVGGASTITEWDLAQGQARRHASGQHGDIWCLGLQPSDEKAPSRLVAGTGDGCLALYSIEDDDLRLQRIILKSASKKDHFVSMAFQSRHIVAIGCSDGSVRIYDLRNGSMLRKMTLGRDLAAGTKDIIVWCVKALPNGDIVSGDSTGQVCIWDGKTYTLAQRITSHKQDVLSLAVSGDGSAIISGGMDKRTVLYRQTKGRWSKVFHKRYHAHDVKSMATLEGRGMSVIVSGGSDACPVVIPLQEAGLENHRTLSHLPQTVPLLSSPKARLVIGWWGREVQIYKLPAEQVVNLGGGPVPKVIKRILIKGDLDISSCSMSSDASLLAVSTMAECKMFRLSLADSATSGEALQVQKVPVSSLANLGASLVAISPDGKWACLIQQGSEIVMLPTGHQDESHVDAPRPIRLRRQKRTTPDHSIALGYMRTISRVSWSPDSKMMAASDLSGYIDTWILGSGDDDDDNSDSSSDESSNQASDISPTWIRNPKGSLIPKLPTAATVLSFSDATPSTTNPDYELLTVTSTSRIIIFNPLSGQLSPWSRRNTPAQLPEPLRVGRDIFKGALWHGSRVWLYGLYSLFMLDLSMDLARAENPQQNHDTDHYERGTKRKRSRLPAAASSGAGGRMELGGLDPKHVKMAATSQSAAGGWVDMDVDTSRARQSSADLDDDDDDETDGGELDLMRGGPSADKEGTAAGRPGWWHSYKYRPILGAVALTPAHQGQLEIALVERPLWDASGASSYLVQEERESRDYP